MDGIEPAANRADVAASRVRYLSTVDPTQGEDPALLPAYDLITYFDVLEHLVDPTALLTWSVGKLAPGGSILAVIPNSAQYSFRWKVLRGDWSMADWGLFDRTHVRFFDIRTAALLRPEGTREADRRYYSLDRGWRARGLARWPNLFALHVALTWTRLPTGARSDGAT